MYVWEDPYRYSWPAGLVLVSPVLIGPLGTYHPLLASAAAMLLALAVASWMVAVMSKDLCEERPGDTLLFPVYFCVFLVVFPLLAIALVQAVGKLLAPNNA